MTQSTFSPVDLQVVQQKLIDKLQPSGWAQKLKSFIMSHEFLEILTTLHDLRNEGKRFTPPLKSVFRAFEECPLADLKVVIIGQDPYPYLNVADGIAFSCGITRKNQPSLDKIFDAVDRTVYPLEKVTHDPDLTRWSNQGVLLLNTALTCQVDKVGSHYDIWLNFIAYVIDMLSLTSSGLIFCLLGNKAQEMESLISPAHYVITASHPASACYARTEWDCSDMFNRINEIIKKNNGIDHTITW